MKLEVRDCETEVVNDALLFRFYFYSCADYGEESSSIDSYYPLKFLNFLL